MRCNHEPFPSPTPDRHLPPDRVQFQWCRHLRPQPARARQLAASRLPGRTTRPNKAGFSERNEKFSNSRLTNNGTSLLRRGVKKTGMGSGFISHPHFLRTFLHHTKLLLLRIIAHHCPRRRSQTNYRYLEPVLERRLRLNPDQPLTPPRTIRVIRSPNPLTAPPNPQPLATKHNTTTTNNIARANVRIGIIRKAHLF
jgi:hypothetical protein